MFVSVLARVCMHAHVCVHVIFHAWMCVGIEIVLVHVLYLVCFCTIFFDIHNLIPLSKVCGLAMISIFPHLKRSRK